jgi:hypothetical protein
MSYPKMTRGGIAVARVVTVTRISEWRVPARLWYISHLMGGTSTKIMAARTTEFFGAPRSVAGVL